MTNITCPYGNMSRVFLGRSGWDCGIFEWNPVKLQTGAFSIG
jgi:hypothetical protein